MVVMDTPWPMHPMKKTARRSPPRYPMTGAAFAVTETGPPHWWVNPELSNFGQTEKGHGKTAVPAGGAVSGDIGFKYPDIHCRFGHLEVMPGGKPRIPAADDDHIRFFIPVRGRVGCDVVGEGLKPPVFFAVIAHRDTFLNAMRVDIGGSSFIDP